MIWVLVNFMINSVDKVKLSLVSYLPKSELPKHLVPKPGLNPWGRLSRSYKSDSMKNKGELQRRGYIGVSQKITG